MSLTIDPECCCTTCNWCTALNLQQLHWLPMRQWVLFKIAILVFQCVNGQAPPYLADDYQLASDVQCLSMPTYSSNSVTCIVRRTLNSYGDQFFAAASSRVWNSLPAELRPCDSLGQFKRRSKTHLFGLLDHSTL